ncbi:tyrosine-type recombinase/integrase [Pseudomonas asiatica]|uniref:tyrosine-type recombinase/integrase n=1 Tax=Pseudomonas asiatica TaxID=2219225 RepID=UPI00383AE0C8
MRIPVHPDDLIRNRGFKSLAKQLRKLLHGPTRVALSFAEGILAKGFGYESFYDLEQTAKQGSPAQATMTESEAKSAILTAITAALQLGDTIANPHELKKLVDSFALASLVAFKQPSVVPVDPKQLYLEVVQRLRKAANLYGTSRERALFVCMQAGMRSTEIRSARWIGNQAVFQEVKVRGDEYKPLPESCQDVIARHARDSKLSEGDLLFHSHKDRKRPIPPTTLSKMLTALARKAGVKPEHVTATQIRHSVIKNDIAELTGHRSRTTTLDYIAKDGDEINPTLH